MDKLIFLDTETTGTDFLSDRLFEVSYKLGKKIVSGYFKPPIPISIKASSITHVTNKMVAKEKPFLGSKLQKDLEKLLLGNILVAHNAAYDISVLDKEGISVPKFICTVKVARFLDSENVIPEYNLQYLRYYFELEVDAKAHDASSDVLVLEAVFKKLFDLMLKEYKTEDKVIEKMLEVSANPFLIRSFSFGKYKGRLVEEIVGLDKGYLQWLLVQKMQKEGGEEDWIYTLKYHLKEIS